MAREFTEAVRNLGAVFLLSDSSDEESGSRLEPVEETSAAQAAEQNEMLDLLRQSLDSMAEEQATILRQLYFDGQSMTDIARERNVHKATISRAHHKAILALRDALGVEGEVPD